MSILEYPGQHQKIALYLIQVVFEDRLGLKIDELRSGKCWSFSKANSRKILKFESSSKEWHPRVARSQGQFFTPSRADLERLDCGHLGEFPIPDQQGLIFEKSEEAVQVNPLFLSAIFIILAGLPEQEDEARDQHDRQNASNVAWLGEGLEGLPLVDYYVEMIQASLREVFPEIPLRESKFQVSPSHDVDWPFLYRAMSPGVVLRRCLGDVIRRKKPWQVPKTLRNWRKSRNGNPENDPFYSFDWIMAQSESRGLTSTFYFITDHSHPTMDGTYTFDDPCIHRLLEEIHGRGHAIGLHASYNSYLDGKQIQREFEILRATCDDLGIEQEEWGSRQHFLRWRTPETARHLAAAGIDFDATLGLAETGGFRNGTCHEFPIFDHEKGETLAIREKPLVAMECSFIDERYRNLGVGEEALAAMLELKNQCRKVGGDFQILWHNDRFGRDPKEAALYQAVLDGSLGG